MGVGGGGRGVMEVETAFPMFFFNKVVGGCTRIKNRGFPRWHYAVAVREVVEV